MKTIKNRKKDSVEQFTKADLIKKMLDDQKYIREAIQNGVSFEELRKQGFKFATV